MRLVLPVVLLCGIVLAGCSAGDAPPGEDAEPTATGTSTTSDAMSPPPASSTTSTSSSSTTTTGPQPTACPTTPCTINIQGNAFVGGSIVVRVGDTVRWVQKDSTTHTVTADDGSFDSGNLVALPTQDTFEHTFTAAGSFPYHCEVHPSMKATITVVS